MASIQGKVVEFYTRRPVRGSVVRADGATAITDSAGRFSVVVPIGVTTLRVTHREFHPYITSLNITRPTAYDAGTITLQSLVRAL